MFSPKKRILVIDDDVDSCEMLSFSLSYVGYDVTTTQNPNDALASSAIGQFDLYLLDNRLPESSGIEICEQLTILAPQIPVVILSGATREVDRRKGAKAGAAAYLAKPVEMSVLERTLLSLTSKGHE
jgi:two-component system, NtrC family, response regulator HydG